MLVATDKDGNYYMASNNLEKKDYFYICQPCKENVFLKYGTEKIPHFAHYPGFNEHNWEKESYDHLLMKIKIFEYFKKFDWVKSITLETHIKEGNLRLIPDILIITKNNEKIAVECQVSNYSTGVLKEKTNEYSYLGIYVMWIFHDKLLKFFNKNKKYFDSPLIKINTEDNVIKNILIKRFYIYNSYVTIYQKCDDNFMDWINKNKVHFVYMSDERYYAVNQFDDNIYNEFLRTKDNSNNCNIQVIVDKLNKCFMQDRIPVYAEKSSEFSIIISRMNKNAEILLKYDMLFSYDQIYYKNTLNNEIEFIRGYYNSNVNFDKYNLINDNNKNFNIVLDNECPLINTINKKILSKFFDDDISKLFSKIDRLW